MTSLSDTDLAYLAGLFDGEGSINAHLRDDKHCKLLRVNLALTNTNKDVIDWIREVLPGAGMYVRHKDHPRWKPVYQLQWQSPRSGQICELLFPYLRIKQEQAFIAIQLCELMIPAGGQRKKGVPMENMERRVELTDALRSLNARGSEQGVV